MAIEATGVQISYNGLDEAIVRHKGYPRGLPEGPIKPYKGYRIYVYKLEHRNEPGFVFNSERLVESMDFPNHGESEILNEMNLLRDKYSGKGWRLDLEHIDSSKNLYKNNGMIYKSHCWRRDDKRI